jgi:hypothetical protein
VRQFPQIPRVVENEYDGYKRDPHDLMPSQERFQILLKTLIQQYFDLSASRVFILIDAYDEFINTPKDEQHERACLLSFLKNLCSTGQTRVLVTTRPQYYGTIQAAFSDVGTAIIRGESIDIERYLEDRLDRINAAPSMKEKIKSAIMEGNKTENWLDIE